MLSLYQVDVPNTSRHQMSHGTKHLKRIVLKGMMTGWLQKEFTQRNRGSKFEGSTEKKHNKVDS